MGPYSPHNVNVAGNPESDYAPYLCLQHVTWSYMTCRVDYEVEDQSRGSFVQIGCTRHCVFPGDRPLCFMHRS